MSGDSLNIANINLNYDAKLILIAPDREGQRILVLEPFSASTIALLLAEGAIQWVGAKVMESVFGERSASELINEAVIKIAQIVRQAIQEEALRRAYASTEALKETLAEYTRAGGDDRLSHATQHSTLLVADLASMRLLGHHGYLVAAGLKISVLQERVRRFGNQERENLREFIQTASRHAESMIDAWNEWFDHHRFSQIQCVQLHSGNFEPSRKGEPGEPPITFCHFMDRDSKIRVTPREPYATQERKNYINAARIEMNQKHIEPTVAVVSKWRAIPIDANP